MKGKKRKGSRTTSANEAAGGLRLLVIVLRRLTCSIALARYNNTLYSTVGAVEVGLRHNIVLKTAQESLPTRRSTSPAMLANGAG